LQEWLVASFPGRLGSKLGIKWNGLWRGSARPFGSATGVFLSYCATGILSCDRRGPWPALARDCLPLDLGVKRLDHSSEEIANQAQALRRCGLVLS